LIGSGEAAGRRQEEEMSTADATGRVAAESRAPQAGAPRLRREIGVVGLLFTSVGSIIGSGWLFGALSASQIAGPAALLSWVIGGFAVILLALTHAELGAMYPVAGGSARFPHYAFGGLAGFAGGWFAFLGAVTTAPIEVEAALQYSTNYVHGLTRVSGGTPVLTASGYAVAAVLMLVFSAINVMGVRWLAETNKAIVWWKIAIPVLTVIVLVATAFHPHNFSAGGGFMPFGLKGVFTAVAAGGVIFAYLGFEQAIQLGGETRNPRRNIPLAVVGSMVLGVVLYILLQVAFLGALKPSTLAHGWTSVAFAGNGAIYGPFAGLATGLGLGWLATLLYIDAIVSPGGTGLLYVGTSSRISFALGRNRYIPRPFANLSARRVPALAIAFSFVCGMFLFLPFPGWQKLVGFITAASSLSYGMAAIALTSLRKQDPERERPFRLPAAWLLSPIGFIVANFIVYWSSWPTVWRLMVALGIGFLVFVLYRMFGDRSRMPRLDLRGAMWLPPYLAGMAIISYVGRYEGRSWLPFWVDIGVVAAFSVAIFVLAVAVRLPDDEARAYIEDLDPMIEDEGLPA
jgi:amino acid transporter